VILLFYPLNSKAIWRQKEEPQRWEVLGGRICCVNGVFDIENVKKYIAQQYVLKTDQEVGRF
jgi:hypothetical protein